MSNNSPAPEWDPDNIRPQLVLDYATSLREALRPTPDADLQHVRDHNAGIFTKLLEIELNPDNVPRQLQGGFRGPVMLRSALDDLRVLVFDLKTPLSSEHAFEALSQIVARIKEALAEVATLLTAPAPAADREQTSHAVESRLIPGHSPMSCHELLKEFERRHGSIPPGAEAFLYRLIAKNPACGLRTEAKRRNEPRILFYPDHVWPLLEDRYRQPDVQL
jgi:hypothetical protein